MHLIKSLQNPTVKHLTQLVQSKSYRDEKKKVVISGKKMIEELSKTTPIRTLLIEQDLFVPADNTFLVTPEILKKIIPASFDEGAVAELDLPPFQDLKNANRIVILDRVQDPGNVGTILRTALALGFDGAFLTNGCADPFNDKALRSAKGATFHLPLGFGHINNLYFKGTLFAGTMKGEPLETITFKKPFGIVLGSEGQGVSPEILKISRELAIPLHSEVESLNVAAAGAIILYRASLHS